MPWEVSYNSSTAFGGQGLIDECSRDNGSTGGGLRLILKLGFFIFAFFWLLCLFWNIFSHHPLFARAERVSSRATSLELYLCNICKDTPSSSRSNTPTDSSPTVITAQRKPALNPRKLVVVITRPGSHTKVMAVTGSVAGARHTIPRS